MRSATRAPKLPASRSANRLPAWWSVALLVAPGGRQLGAAPRETPFSGTQKVEVAATAAVGGAVPPRTLTATLEVTMTGTGQRRTVRITDKQDAKAAACELKGHLDHGSLVFAPTQLCEVEVATAELCVLSRERCDARATGLRCDQERAAHHLGRVTAKLVDGRATETDGAWALALDYRAEACVLVQGENRGAPILVQGIHISVGKP
jgi:hypothetical protein